MRSSRRSALLIGLGLAIAINFAACGGGTQTPAPTTTPGVEARLHVAITDMTPGSGSVTGTWNVTFIYNGHVVTAPTAPGLSSRVDLVGKKAIIVGSVSRAGSFVILSIEPDTS
jgi:hypothetical protein